jgi:hypothetical protein
VERRGELGEIPKHLASEIAGAAVQVDLSELIAAGGALRSEAAEATVRRGWELMARTGRRLVRDGAIIHDQAETETELSQRIADFQTRRLPRLRDLGVV